MSMEESLARIEELHETARRFQAARRSASTVRAYESDWQDFTVWCRSLGVESLPADPGTVAAYLSDLAAPADDRAGLKVSTITRRRVAIGGRHRAASFPDPCRADVVAETMSGIRRVVGVAKVKKQGVTTADLQAAVERLDSTRLIDVRDRAVLLLGFASGMRRSELAALKVEDVEPHAQGLLVHLRRSKTDQEAKFCILVNERIIHHQ